MSKQDDYTYPEETIDTSEYSDSAGKKGTENFQSIVTNKRLMAPLGIIFFVFLVNFLFSEDESEAVEAVADEPVVVEVVPENTAQMDRQAQILDENSKMMGGFLKQNNKNQQDINNMNTKYTQLEKQVQSLTSDISALNSQIRNTNASITALRNELMEKKKPEVKPVARKVIQLQNYALRAVIEGRAWIRDAHNMRKTMTVSVGDEIPTYGKVVSIHPIEGLIQTTSGRVIQFPESE